MDPILTRAIERGDAAAVDAILAARPELAAARVDAADGATAGRTALHLAVEHDRAETVDVLIRRGVPVDARNADGRTALHDAIEDGRVAIQDRLLAHGAKVDVCAAAILGRLDRLREILDQDPEAVDDRATGLSPLGWAAYGNRADAARELIRRGARMDDGELLCAASVGHVRVGRVLLDHGADPNAFDRRAGGTALHAAASMRYTCDSSAFVLMLLERGADPTIRSARGKTAVEIAEDGRRRQREAVRSGDDPRFSRDWDAVIRALRRASGPG